MELSKCHVLLNTTFCNILKMCFGEMGVSDYCPQIFLFQNQIILLEAQSPCLLTIRSFSLASSIKSIHITSIGLLSYLQNALRDSKPP